MTQFKILSLCVHVQYSNFQVKLMDPNYIIILLFSRQGVGKEGGKGGDSGYHDFQPHQNQSLVSVLVERDILKNGWVRSCSNERIRSYKRE